MRFKKTVASNEETVGELRVHTELGRSESTKTIKTLNPQP